MFAVQIAQIYAEGKVSHRTRKGESRRTVLFVEFFLFPWKDSLTGEWRLDAVHQIVASLTDTNRFAVLGIMLMNHPLDSKHFVFSQYARVLKRLHDVGYSRNKPAAPGLLLSLVVLMCCGTSLFAAEPATSGLHTDIEYAQAGKLSLTLDAFVPEGTGPFPCCILVHGGGLTKGNKQSYIKPLFESLSQAGFAWFTINYRLAPAYQWPACAEDVETAIRWVKAHAGEYKVDIDRIALIGESAGGYLVGYVGARITDETRVAAIVPFYAALDRVFQVRHFNKLSDSTAAVLGVTELNEQTWQRLHDISATTYIHKGMPPYLLIHGDQDQQVPYEQSVRFQQQMAALGNRCDLITIPGGGHGMGGWARLNSDYQKKMIDWLDNTLRKRD